MSMAPPKAYAAPEPPSGLDRHLSAWTVSSTMPVWDEVRFWGDWGVGDFGRFLDPALLPVSPWDGPLLDHLLQVRAQDLYARQRTVMEYSKVPIPCERA